MQFFKRYVMNFLHSSEDDRLEDIILKRYSLNGFKKHTLKELGQYYGLSRERIRQIESKHLDKLKDLIQDRNPINQLSNKIKMLVEKERILPREKIESILNTPKDLKSWELFYLFLLDLSYFNQGKIYYSNDIKRNDLVKTIRQIRTTLKNHTIPMSKENLFNQLNTIPLNHLELETLIQVTGATTTEVNGKIYYQPRIDNDWSAGKFAYLILWENGNPMTTKEIVEEMNDRFGVDKQMLNTVNQMGTIDEIQNIDLHTWALSEWKLESQYIFHIMKDVLREHNKPMSTKEIVAEIKEKRNDVRFKSVDAYTHLEAFTRLDNGKVILKN